MEVKSFLGRSLISDFHQAMGQFLDYKSALEETEPERMLFLASPIDAYKHEIFQGRFIQKRLQEEEVKLLVFDPADNIITLWKK